MSRLAALAGASILAITVSTAAGASTITATSIGFSDGSFRVDITGPYVVTSPGSPLRVNAGRLQMNTTLGAIFVWCVDLYESLRTGGTVYSIGTLAADISAPPGPLSPATVARVGGLAEAGDLALSAAPGNSVTSAAYQSAIWQAIYGGTYTPKGTAAQNAAFNTLLASLIADTSFSDTSGTLYKPLTDLKGRRVEGQQLYGDDPDPTVPVPLPGALGLFGFALAGLVLAGRKKAA